MNLNLASLAALSSEDAIHVRSIVEELCLPLEKKKTEVYYMSNKVDGYRGFLMEFEGNSYFNSGSTFKNSLEDAVKSLDHSETVVYAFNNDSMIVIVDGNVAVGSRSITVDFSRYRGRDSEVRHFSNLEVIISNEGKCVAYDEVSETVLVGNNLNEVIYAHISENIRHFSLVDEDGEYLDATLVTSYDIVETIRYEAIDYWNAYFNNEL